MIHFHRTRATCLVPTHPRHLCLHRFYFHFEHSNLSTMSTAHTKLHNRHHKLTHKQKLTKLTRLTKLIKWNDLNLTYLMDHHLSHAIHYHLNLIWNGKNRNPESTEVGICCRAHQELYNDTNPSRRMRWKFFHHLRVNWVCCRARWELYNDTQFTWARWT